MALADPLGRSAFANLFRVADVRLTPQWSQQRSLRGGGDVLYADRAPMLWRAEITTIPVEHSEAYKLLALINSRAGGIKTSLIYNYALPYPSSDPTGSIFGAATPIVGTITNRYVVAFTGFPASYVIPAGTFFQIVFNSTRRYLGQFAEDKVASGAGAVSAVEVAPALPDGIVPGDAVQMLQPAGKFRIIPGSAHVTIAGGLHSTVAFSAEQTYAA